ncbi:MAG: dipeptide epimerase [Euryarchaeota archaeon]|nr:dipeptide epimerase [Euryarchaeota archaeon]
MKIEEIEIYSISVPLKEPFTISLGTIENAENVILYIKTDKGLVGYGEAAPSPRITGDTPEQIINGLKVIKPLLLGKDPSNIPRIEEEIERAMRGNTSMKAAIDMALLDLKGKTAKMPVYDLLGRYRAAFKTDYTIGINEPKKMAADAIKIVEQGFDTLKVKVGTGLIKDVERVARIHDAVGDEITIRVDANQGWSPKEAVKTLIEMEKYAIELVEQPVPWWNIEGLKWVRDHVTIPVMADESVHSPFDAMRIIKEGAVDLINIKLMKCGGITNGLKIAHIAEAAGIECMVGCMVETNVSVTAASHLVASARNITRVDLDTSLFLAEEPVEGGVSIKKGRIQIPDTYGLGIKSVRV